MQKITKILLVVIGVSLVIFLILATVNYVQNQLVTSTGVSYEIASDNAGVGLSYGVSTGLGGSAGSTKSISNDARVQTPQSAPTSDSSLTTERLIIKTGSLSIVVKDVSEVVKQIAKYAENNGGFVITSEISKRGDIPYGSISVRIPADKFEQGVGDVKGLGEVKSENVNGQDVTEEYVDLDAQIINLRATEKQFLNIMQRAEKIEDILAVQRELSNVRGNIDMIAGRMKYLETSAELSTLQVSLSTDPDVLPTYEATNKWKPLAVLKMSVRALVEVGKIIANFIIFLVIFIPVWILVGLMIWLGIKIYHKNKTNKIKQSSEINFKG